MASPARNTRSRDPLPAVDTNTNTAYGTRGTPNVDGQIADSASGFAGAFGTARTTTRKNPPRGRKASAEPESEPEPPVSASKRGARRTRQRAQTPEVIEEASEDELGNTSRQASIAPSATPFTRQPSLPPQSRPAARIPPINHARQSYLHRQASVGSSQMGTSLDQIAPYEQRNQAPVVRNNIPPALQVNTQDTQSSDSPSLRRAAEPWWTRVFFASIPDYLDRIKRVCRTIGLINLFILLLALVSGITISRTNEMDYPINLRIYAPRAYMGLRLLAGLPAYEQPPTRAEMEWQTFRYGRHFNVSVGLLNHTDAQYKINLDFAGRIEKLEDFTHRLQRDVIGVERDMIESLPKSILVQKDDKGIVIPTIFWTAFGRQLRGDETLWQDFLKANEDAIESLAKASFNKSLAAAQSADYVVGRAELGQILLDQSNNLKAEVIAAIKEDIDQERRELLDLARQVARSEVKEALSRYQGFELLEKSALDVAKDTFTENSVFELMNVNYFAPGKGAKVDVRLTSPTAARVQSNAVKAWFASWFLKRNPPLAALHSWREAGDAWCAAESDGNGKAQLAVITKGKVHPSQLIIEHIPSVGSSGINTAPQDFELWVDMTTKDAAEHVEGLIQSTVSGFLRPQCSQAPGDGFVCIASGRYDIHEQNWVQKFDVPLITQQHGVSSARYVVRFTSNWGASNTCLYRLRLGGSERGYD